MSRIFLKPKNAEEENISEESAAESSPGYSHEMETSESGESPEKDLTLSTDKSSREVDEERGLSDSSSLEEPAS